MSEHLIPERLKAARENMGITMAEAARRLNLSKIGHCRYEYGERTPSSQTVEVIARCFNTSVDYLTGKTSDPAADFIIISKKKEPELFEFVTTYKSSDYDSFKKMIAYYQKIQNINDKTTF